MDTSPLPRYDTVLDLVESMHQHLLSADKVIATIPGAERDVARNLESEMAAAFEAYAKIRTRLVSDWVHVDPGPPVLLHQDLNDGNVLMSRAEGGRPGLWELDALIDWESAAVAPQNFVSGKTPCWKVLRCFSVMVKLLWLKVTKAASPKQAPRCEYDELVGELQRVRDELNDSKTWGDQMNTPSSKEWRTVGNETSAEVRMQARRDELQRSRAERRASFSAACGPEPTAARASARVSKWLQERHNPHEYSTAAPNPVEVKRRFGEVIRQAVREGEYDAVQWLLGVCPEAIDFKDEEVGEPTTSRLDDPAALGGLSAIFHALCEGYEAIALSLLDRGANVRARTPAEQTCLHAACYCGVGRGLIERLVQAAPDLINECDVRGRSAMWYAGELGVTATHKSTFHASSVCQHTPHFVTFLPE